MPEHLINTVDHPKTFKSFFKEDNKYFLKAYNGIEGYKSASLYPSTCPHNALESNLKLIPGFVACFITRGVYMISTCVVPLHLLEVYGAVAVHVIHSEGPRQLVPELIAALIIDKADIPLPCIYTYIILGISRKRYSQVPVHLDI